MVATQQIPQANWNMDIGANVASKGWRIFTQAHMVQFYYALSVRMAPDGSTGGQSVDSAPYVSGRTLSPAPKPNRQYAMSTRSVVRMLSRSRCVLAWTSRATSEPTLSTIRKTKAST